MIATIFLTTPNLPAADSAAPKVIEIHAKRYDFVPAEITLTKGVAVNLKLVSDDVPHSLVIPELHINEVIKAGEDSEVAVTPSQAGDFKGYCGKFCGLGHGKMQLVVHVVNGE